jgi:hypothetical protein
MSDAKMPEGRKLLALYPVILFYLSLAWMVLIGYQQGATAAAPTAVPVTQALPGPLLASNATRVFRL